MGRKKASKKSQQFFDEDCDLTTMLKVKVALDERRRSRKQKVSEIISGDEDDAVSNPHLAFYNKVKLERDAKIAAKAEKYARPATIPYEVEPEVTVDGNGKIRIRRPISDEMWKNRGLTRWRNKNKRNPRTNGRKKYEWGVVRRKGQVREHRTLHGAYGGETTGINAMISRSIRF